MKFIVYSRTKEFSSEDLDLSNCQMLHLKEAFEESTILGFSIEEYNPDAEYRLNIGDIPIIDKRTYRKSIEWQESQYLANSFGKIPITLEAKKTGTEFWNKILTVEAFAHPSKLTLIQYKKMLQDIAFVCKGLLLDVVSKARSSFGWITSKSIQDLSGIEEHIIINQFLSRFEPIIERINRDPGSYLTASNSKCRCYGNENFTNRSFIQITKNGFDPREKGSVRPFQCEIQTKIISYDTWENRQIKAFCKWIAERAALVSNKAQLQIDSINREKQWRKLAPIGQISLWDFEDAPRLSVLEKSIDSCRKIQNKLYNYSKLYKFLDGVTPISLDLKPTPKFLQDLFYAHAYSSMIEFISTSGIMFDKGILEQKLKDTSKLYEYWSFIILFFYFKNRLELPIERKLSLLNPSGSRDTYVLNLNSGDYVIFNAPNGLRLAIHYEPTFFPKNEAKKIKSRFFRSTFKGRHPLVPDIYIELLSGPLNSPKLEYGIIMDCKYTNIIRDDQWAAVEKYQSELYESIGNRNVANQLWIIHPTNEYDWMINIQTDSLEELVRSQNTNIQGKLALTPVTRGNSEDSLKVIFDHLDDSIGKIIKTMIE